MAESFAALEGKIGVGEDAIKYYTVQMSAAKLIKNITCLLCLRRLSNSFSMFNKM